ncbi:MAG: ribbon-helix-helix domain-containing protein [Caldanaerobacter sp.]
MRLKTISFKIDEGTLLALDILSGETGVNRSELIRKAIMVYLKETKREKSRIKVLKE